MKEVRTELYIEAKPEKVWQVLAAGPNWGAWNSFVTQVEGPLEKGATLNIRIQMPGSMAMRFRPKVLVAEPDRELRWLGRLLLPGLFDGEHYFILETEGSGTRLVHGERFSGLLIGLMSEAKLRPGFEALNQGLKQKAEAMDGMRGL